MYDVHLFTVMHSVLLVMKGAKTSFAATLSQVLLVLGKFDFECLVFFILAILHWYSVIVQSLTVSDCFIK